MSKYRFSWVLTTALGVLLSVSAKAADDDLMLDMGLEPTQSASPKTSADTLPAPTVAPQVTPPPATAQKPRKKKNIAAGIDLLTRIKSGMAFNTEEVEDWVMSGQDINQCMENGRTMLIYLVTKHTDTEAVRYLINNGADTYTHCSPRYEALFEAVKHNPSSPIVETLIDNNANIVATDEEGNTALLLTAAHNPNPKIINTLMEYGLKIDDKNKYGQDAFTLATYYNGRIPMLQTLLDSGADINAQDNAGRTPLMAAAVSGNDMVMQYLIKRGADFNAKDNQGVSVLDYYTKRAYLKTLGFEPNPYASIAENLEKTYRFIAENHLKYNNALLQSLHAQNVEQAVTDALHHNADVDILDSIGCTQFLNAVKDGHPINIISKFITGGANVNATCQEGKNALMFLFSPANQNKPVNEQIEKIRLLADNGIKPDAKDTNGSTALIYAAAHGAAPGIIEAIINSGANVNATDNTGETALLAAIKHNAPEKSVRPLLENNADANQANNRGETPLWSLLTANGNPALVEALLEFGANVEAPNAAGTLPLWYVLTTPVNEATVIHILSAIPNANLPNTDGDTPLLYALKKGLSPNIIQALLANGANPDIQGKDGQNAYDILKNSRYFNEAMKIHTREKVLGSQN